MKKTNKEIINFNIAGREYLKHNTEDTKLKYCIDKVLNRISKNIKKFNEKREDIRLDNANVDEQDNVLFTQTEWGRDYKFTKEGLKKCDKELDILLEEEVEFEAFYCKEFPKDFPKKYWLKAFTDFVIEDVNIKNETNG